MNKLFVFATLFLVAAMAAEKTYLDTKQCKKDAGELCNECKEDASSTKCKEARSTSSGLTADKVAKQMACEAVVQCFEQAAEEQAKKKEDQYNAKHNEMCPKDKKKCKDQDAFCKIWADAKECTKNPDWMLANCQNSCCDVCTGKTRALEKGKCPEGDKNKAQCVDNKHKDCARWATAGECDTNPKWMRPNCMSSCCSVCHFDAEGCPKTKDKCTNAYAGTDAKKNKQCSNWAKAGECTKNPKWMKKNCGKDCCTACAAKAPVKKPTAAPATTPVRTLYNQPVRYTQAAIPRYSQPVWGGYSTAAMPSATFGSYYSRPASTTLPASTFSRPATTATTFGSYGR